MNSITLPTIHGLQVVQINEIVRAEADGNCTRVYLSNNKIIGVPKILKEVEKLFPKRNKIFFRIHKSHLINLHYFQEYVNHDSHSVIMKDGTKIPIAQGKIRHFLAKIEKLLH